MKKIVLIFISVACIITGCATSKTNKQATIRSESPYNANLVISPSVNTKNTIIALGPIINFEKIFPDPDKIKGFKITSAEIVSVDQIKKNLGMFKSVRIYLTMGDGSNEVLIASRTDIPAYSGNSLLLNINKSVNGENVTGVSGTQNNIDPNLNYTSVEQAISGKVAGVQVVSSGSPGGAPQIRIRGINSITLSSAPLYIVDDLPVSNIQMLNPNDIESIEVLKDIGQTSMYGMRGANGVIVIKTKTGKSDSDKISGSLDNFVIGTAMRIRLEYVLRYPLRSETGLNVNVNFRTASN